MGVQLAVVVGGGNFIRGATFSKCGRIPRATADYMGMLSTVLNAWLVLALEKLAQMHRLDGDESAAQPLETWAQKVRGALEKLIVDGLLGDGYDSAGAPHQSFSVHAQTLGLMLGLRGLDETLIVETALMPLMKTEVLPKPEREILPSAYWVTYVFSALTERGYGAQILPFIRRYWQPMAEFGSTWESYLGTLGTGSRSHAWSAHPLFHLMQTIGGFSQTAAAWKRIRFAPLFEGESGGATVPTPQGNLVSRWQREGKAIHVALEVPVGIEAEIVLPGLRETRGAGAHEWTVRDGNSLMAKPNIL